MIDEPWVSKARCREVDPELFYPEVGGASTRHLMFRQAVSVCSRCEVRQECYNFAYENDEQYGIWGGHYAFQIYRNKMREGK